MTVLATPVAWWRGLGGLTRSGSSVEGLAWALYDFANTIFSFAILSFAMGPWTTMHLGETTGTFLFTLAASGAVALNAAVSPVLGAMSDRTGGRKRYLFAFTAVCIVPTMFIGVLDIGLGLLAFAVANFGFQAALIYYDALLPDVARPETRGRLSGIGVSLGYVGSIVSALLLGTTLDADGDITAASFVLVGSLFAIFAIPIFVLVRERPRPDAQRFSAGAALRSWSQLASTVRRARQRPGLLRFVIGRFFYTDPVNTAIAVMSIFAINAVGFTAGEARYVLIGLIVVAIIAAFFWGILCDRIGPKRTLMLVLGSWAAGLLLIGLWLEKGPFLVAGAILGSGLGGVAVTDRLYLLRLTRPEEVGEMLGLYGMAGKLSAVVGPLLFGAIVLVMDPERNGNLAYQVAILSLLLLLVIGVLILRGVPEGTPHPQAEDRLGQPLEPSIVPPGETPP
ncbi:MAG TPA: MFS transporter [Candidatus Limnocylindria bacterium]|nr:MFS transporter [Candidatus Limnocylindria bacterium]